MSPALALLAGMALIAVVTLICVLLIRWGVL